MKRILLLVAAVAAAIILATSIMQFEQKPSDEDGKVADPSHFSREALRPRTLVSSRISAFERSNTMAVASGEDLKHLSPEQLEAYLKRLKRNADSLLNAYEETHDTNYLKEAAEKFPGNPLIQLTMLTDDLTKTNLSAEDRKAWLDRLKAALPQNGLPDCLAAMDDFRNGQNENALKELSAAAQKNSLDPMNHERLQNREEMFLMAGLSPVDAKTQAAESLLLPLESQMKNMAWQLADLEKGYLAAGDAAAAQQIATLGVDLSRRWGDPKASVALVTELVGMAMENRFLSKLNPDTSYDFLGGTARQKMDEIKKQRDEIRTISTEFDTVFPSLSDNEKIAYFNRTRTMGERNAIVWMVQTYGSGTSGQ